MPIIPPAVSETTLTGTRTRFRDTGFQFRHYPSYRYKRSDLVAGFRRISNHLESRGQDVRLLTTVDDIARTGTNFVLTLRDSGGTRLVSASRVVLATGRSGADLLSKLAPTFPVIAHIGRCDVGVRLEFPYTCWPDIDKHHNDLKLEFGSARTFCVCTNGVLAPYRVGDAFLLEGYSEPASHSGFTNLGIVTRVTDCEPHLFRNILQRVTAISSGARPVREALSAYLNTNQPTGSIRSSITFWNAGRISECYPSEIAAKIQTAVRRFASAFLPRDDWPRIGVFGPEFDYYWPTMTVHTDFRTDVERLYVIGDGTGRFRGILQAFASGLHLGSSLQKDIHDAT